MLNLFSEAFFLLKIFTCFYKFHTFCIMKKIWINGTFDVLHHGHFKMLAYGVSLGYLCVGIDSDERVKKMKGEGRPFHTQDQRKFNLSNVFGVSNVFIFNDEEELIDIIKKYDPDIHLIGSDYKNKKIIGSEFSKEIIYFDRLPFSTTEILKWDTNTNLR